ncbi:MAG: kinase-like domain-containing protein [Monoraphidium minutum]|nr:MAG: kinase-like domain-containing protein [Monoraphidium minutum]
MADPERADGEEEEIVETDPEGRYYRYGEVVGRGRFKQIYKAFDTQIGIDVAWSKICAEPHHLDAAQLREIVEEMTKGLELEHPNIIKCFKCWEDDEHGCINLITELFTSGNLRQYRNLHKHLDLKAVKRMARQILRGLEYLHGMHPPLMHGDLRCDKIYVNGHSGEIKIGDLGLATLIPLRWEADGGEGPSPECADAVNRHDVRTDIFAFGLCMLELLTLKQLDPQHSGDPLVLLGEVADDDSKRFIAHCVGPLDGRPTAEELLEDGFLQVKKAPLAGAAGGGGDGGAQMAAQPEPMASGDDGEGEGHIAIGKLRGEDYNFEFHGKVKDGKMHFRLYMTQVSDLPGAPAPPAANGDAAAAAAASDAGGEPQQPPPPALPVVRTIDFTFDPEVDTADNLAAEISDEFALSPTDTEICAAALREWLAKEMPGSEGGK